MGRRRSREPWNEPRRARGIPAPRVAERGFRVDLFPTREQRVHRHENRKHGERYERRPLHQEAEHDEHEADVLRMAYASVWARCCETMPALGVIKHPP